MRQLVITVLLTLAAAAAVYSHNKARLMGRPMMTDDGTIRPMYTYDVTKTFVVDRRTTDKGTNFLVRGSQPLDAHGNFAYAELAAALKSQLNIELANYHLLVVALIHNTRGSSHEDLKREFADFGMTATTFDSTFPLSLWPPYLKGLDLTVQYGTQVAGNRGSIIWYPLQGCKSYDNCQAIEDVEYGFSKLVDLLSALLDNNQPTVIYVHCTLGNDRVGSLIASYRMKHMGMSLEDTLRLDAPNNGSKAFAQTWDPGSLALVRWYATTLTTAQVSVNDGGRR